MTQDEKWMHHYEQMMAFMQENQRRPSKHRAEDRQMLDWFKHNKKLARRGEMHTDRMQKFSLLMKEADRCRRLNQYDHPTDTTDNTI